MDKIQRATEIHRSMTPHQMALRIVELEDIAEIVVQSASERSKRITELLEALELAEEAVRAKHVPAPVIEQRDKLLDAMRQTLAMLRVTSHGPSAANKAEDMLHAAIFSIGTSHSPGAAPKLGGE